MLDRMTFLRCASYFTTPFSDFRVHHLKPIPFPLIGAIFGRSRGTVFWQRHLVSYLLDCVGGAAVCAAHQRALARLADFGQQRVGGVGMRADEIGRASCRERSVDLGGRRIIKKKKKKKKNNKTTEKKKTTHTPTNKRKQR